MGFNPIIFGQMIGKPMSLRLMIHKCFILATFKEGEKLC